jgi:hypothetical protein
LSFDHPLPPRELLTLQLVLAPRPLAHVFLLPCVCVCVCVCVSV